VAVSIGYKQSTNHLARRMASKAATLRARPKPFAKDWLIAKYITDGLDCVQIGAIAQRDPKSIWSWLKYYGIPTRPRGANHAHLPKDGSTFLGKHHSAKTRKVLSDIALASGRVPFKKENGPPMKGKRGAQTTNWKGGITPERQAFYATDEWREAVKKVWTRANAKCERCGAHHNTAKARGTFHIHHIESFMVRELRAVVSNLALMCKRCHLFVHSNANATKEFIGGKQ